jgi:hypothetical protein
MNTDCGTPRWGATHNQRHRLTLNSRPRHTPPVVPGRAISTRRSTHPSGTCSVDRDQSRYELNLTVALHDSDVLVVNHRAL